MYIRAFSVIMLLLKICGISAMAGASPDSLSVIVYYPCGSSNVSDISANTPALTYFLQQLDSVRQSPLLTPTRLLITSSTSPEGSLAINQSLTRQRSRSVLEYLKRHSETFRLLSDTMECLHREHTTNHQYGKIPRREYPTLRHSEVRLYLDIQAQESHTLIEQTSATSTQSSYTSQVLPVAQVAEILPTAPEPDSITVTTRPVLFVKTNLLYDLLTFINLSIEVPLTKRLTAEATIVYPWWHSTSKHKTIQMRYVALTPRYYFKNTKTPYTSFFAGLTVGIGQYDLQWTLRGVQGTLWHISPTFGYSHRIAHRWKMEYSASVGFVQTRYNKYTQTADTPYGDIKVKDYPWVKKELNTVLPTSLNVSLVYTFGKVTKTQRHGH